MDTWHKFLLQDINIFQAAINLQMEFKTFLDSSPDDMVKGTVIFSKFHRNGAMLYFSPNASQIAQPLIEKYNALPCSVPSTQKDEDGYLLSLLAGYQLFFTKNFPFENSF